MSPTGLPRQSDARRRSPSMLLFKQIWLLLAHRLYFWFGLVLILDRISDIRSSKVTFTNNGYDSLLVAISSTTPREDAEIVIDNLKVNCCYYNSFLLLESN